MLIGYATIALVTTLLMVFAINRMNKVNRINRSRQVPKAVEGTVVVPEDCKVCRVPHYGGRLCPWAVLERAEFDKTMKKSLPLDYDARKWVMVNGKRCTVWGAHFGGLQSEYVRKDGSDGLDVYGRVKGQEAV